MRKLVVCALLLGALALLAAGLTGPALAQGKKDVKKPARAGVIEVGEGKDGKFRFFVRNADGKLLAMSGPGGFATRKEAEDAIEELREVVAKAKVTAAKKKDVKKDDK